MTAISETKHIPRGLFVICVLYGGMASLAGILGNKLVALGPLAVEAGIFAFILLVVLAGAVAEVYGRATGNRIVVFGFVPIIVSMILIQLVLALPPASFWEEEKRVAFDIILNQSTRADVRGDHCLWDIPAAQCFHYHKAERGKRQTAVAPKYDCRCGESGR